MVLKSRKTSETKISEQVKESVQEQVKEPVQESIQEPVQEQVKVPEVKKSSSPLSTLSMNNKDIASPLDAMFEAMGVVKFGTFPVIKASNGRLKDGSNNDFGTFVNFRPVSWRYRYCITTGESSAAGKKYFRVSDDNISLNDGSGVTVEDYLAELREAGYQNASVKAYIDVVCLFLGSEKPVDSFNEGDMAIIALSPQSVLRWDNLRLSSPIKIAAGIVKPEDYLNLRASAKPEAFKNNEFTVIEFSVNK